MTTLHGYDDIANSGGAAEVALLVGLGLDKYSSVVDLGAGTGQFTVAVAPVYSRFVAVDVSPGMLSACEPRWQRRPSTTSRSSTLGS